MHAPNANCNCVCSFEVCRLIHRGPNLCVCVSLRMCVHVNIVCVYVLGGKWISELKLQSHYKPRSA